MFRTDPKLQSTIADFGRSVPIPNTSALGGGTRSRNQVEPNIPTATLTSRRLLRFPLLTETRRLHHERQRQRSLLPRLPDALPECDQLLVALLRIHGHRLQWPGLGGAPDH